MGSSTPQTNKIKKRAMLKALEKSLGVVTTAAKQVGMDRSQHYEWLKTDPEYKKQVESIADMAIDFVESKLFKSIEAENVTAQIFYLKTKAKHRGYVERSELTGADGKDLMPQYLEFDES